MDAMERLGERVRHLEALETVMDHVLASNPTTVIPGTSTWTKEVFATEVYDTGGEYNPATGIFTAKRAGRVNVNFLTIFAAAVWAVGNIVQVQLYKDGGGSYFFDLWAAQSTTPQYVALKGAVTVDVVLNTTLAIYLWQNSGANKTPIGGGSHGHVNFDWLF